MNILFHVKANVNELLPVEKYEKEILQLRTTILYYEH